ncbi:MAG: D-2-hydroxyacid dehydrogenase, partial [Planctomycetaceae bacterium]|nr:D-2-hydroxyacid dehydrogenase [Planctomycetaceae bacterium]
MKLLIFPPIDDARFQRICEIAPGLQVVRAPTPADARREIADADAFYGKITPELLAAAGQIRWIQSPTASLEHYLFPELIAHPVTVTNMRGLFSDVIADHVMGYIIMFARNLHRYRDQQLRHEWSPVGDPQAKTDFVSAPGVVTAVDHAHIHLADTSLGIIGMGAIGREVARRASGFGMTIRGVDPQPDPLPGIVDEIWPAERIPELLRESRFVVIA